MTTTHSSKKRLGVCVSRVQVSTKEGKGKILLPVVTESTRKEINDLLQLENPESWQKHMIHHLKTENPEINTLILQLANRSSDPKSVVMSGYLIYKALELAFEQESQDLLSIKA